MANPPAPTVPNFNSPVGRLATDRYDFESHLEGTNFRHNATQIDLNPGLTVALVPQGTVQEALAALAALSVPPSVPDATISTKGIIQLAGDIAGTSTNVKVTGLQGFPVSTLTPTASQVLTWSGTAWTPTASGSGFVASGDLAGTNVSQQVIGLTGTAGFITITGNVLGFASTSSPGIFQSPTSIANGKDFNFRAQDSTGAGLNGGTVRIGGGAAGAGGLRGGIRLESDGHNLLQVTEPVTGQRVLALVSDFNINAGNMPANSGDMVVFIADCLTPPTSGLPTSGSILYSSGGKLFVTQANGDNFSVGSTSNPSIWGPVGQQVYNVRASAQSTSSTRVTAFSISFNQTAFINASIRVDAIFIGKDEAALSTNTAQYNLNMGYITDNSGNPTLIGATTTVDSRTNGAASGWTTPAFGISGQTLNVNTGANIATTINWFVVIKLSIVQ